MNGKILALAFVLPALIYGLMLAPGLTWAHHGADGGDLVTAAYTLGVPHPPGYPTYTLLAWLFTRLPLGRVAWRVNLLSALSTALAASLICRAVARLAADEPDTPALVAGLGAAWSYAFAPLVWSQALIAEVYALAGLWTALFLERGWAEWADCRLSPRERGGKGLAFFVLGLLWSLGLGVHLTLFFLAPLVVWFVLRPSSRRAVLLPLTLGFLVGLLVWLYLPLRAGRGGVTWGQPATWQGFWWLVSGALYRGYVFASALGGRLGAWAQTWESGLGLLGVGLAAWGVICLAGRRQGRESHAPSGWLAACGLSFVAWNLYALGYDTTDSVVYLVPAFVVGSVWLGVGLADLFRRMPGLKERWLTAVMLVMALATPAWSLARNGAALDLHDDHWAEDFCRAVMKESPPRAILLTSTDRQTFCLWYCQQVEGFRPDVAVVDQGLRGFDWYRAELRRADPNLWDSQADERAPFTLTDERPHCQVHREAQAGWLDCQNSKID